MTTNINLAEFEPTDKMRERWPEISGATKVNPTNARRKIVLPKFVGRLLAEIREIQTDEIETTRAPYITERHELIQVGNHLCYYHQDSDTLHVRQF